MHYNLQPLKKKKKKSLVDSQFFYFCFLLSVRNFTIHQVFFFCCCSWPSTNGVAGMGIKGNIPINETASNIKIKRLDRMGKEGLESLLCTYWSHC